MQKKYLYGSGQYLFGRMRINSDGLKQGEPHCFMTDADTVLDSALGRTEDFCSLNTKSSTPVSLYDYGIKYSLDDIFYWLNICTNEYVKPEGPSKTSAIQADRRIQPNVICLNNEYSLNKFIKELPPLRAVYYNKLNAGEVVILKILFLNI